MEMLPDILQELVPEISTLKDGLEIKFTYFYIKLQIVYFSLSQTKI